jgi:hypothetical protein
VAGFWVTSSHVNPWLSVLLERFFLYFHLLLGTPCFSNVWLGTSSLTCSMLVGTRIVFPSVLMGIELLAPVAMHSLYTSSSRSSAGTSVQIVSILSWNGKTFVSGQIRRQNRVYLYGVFVPGTTIGAKWEAD